MKTQGAIGALLDIYGQAINGLIDVIEGVSDDNLIVITDAQAADENCRSVQTILSHVVHSGYGYATSIHNSKGHALQRPLKIFYLSVTEYVDGLKAVLAYTESVFKELDDTDLEQHDDLLKIKTGWGQLYDIEQLMEHAIVHILRHKRQIENIKRLHFEV